MPRTAELETAATTIHRSAVYELFAQAFAYPDDDAIDALAAAASEVMAGECPVPLLRLAVLARQADRESLEPVFIALNTLSSSPDCPSYESAYFGGDPQLQTQRMADVAGYYRAFGVDATDGGYRPDELSVELEFMGFLGRKAAYAENHLGPPRARQARKAQRVFLQEHLGRWAGVFATNLAESAPAGHFYAVAATTLKWWLEQETRLTGAHPEPVSGPAPVVCEPISHGPEFAGAASFVPMDQLTGG